MILYGVNVLAVVVAAIAAWFFGAAYYGPLGKTWVEAQGKTIEEIKCGGKTGLAKVAPFILSFIAELIMASILAALVIRAGAVTIKSGLAWGALMWFGFMLTTMTTNYAFAGRKSLLTVIDAGHWLGVMLIMGAIIGAFGF